MNNSDLKTKYRYQYEVEMGNFCFEYHEITFEILQDFSNWQHEALLAGNAEIIIFYKD